MTLSIPVISTVTAAIFLDEAVTAVQALGMAVVLIALGFAIRVSSAEVAEVPAVPAVPEAADVAAGPAVPAPPAS
jgi:hypothetical protein